MYSFTMRGYSLLVVLVFYTTIINIAHAAQFMPPKMLLLTTWRTVLPLLPVQAKATLFRG